MPGEKIVYQLKVTIKDSKPPIWRRVLVPGNVTLYDLHEILQVVMGWENYHLHMFTIAGEIYGDPEDDETGDLGTENETRYRLDQLGLLEKARFSYEYDFGDSWEHAILVEKILPAEKGVHYPVCVTGKRACPPEDVGGVWGYEEFLQAIADPENEEHEEYMGWIGPEFDPEEFDLDVSYNGFADRLIAQSGLEWHAPDQTFAHSIMQSAIQRIVVQPVTAFAVLECECGAENTNGYENKKLTHIRLTPVGKGLLGLLK